MDTNALILELDTVSKEVDELEKLALENLVGEELRYALNEIERTKIQIQMNREYLMKMHMLNFVKNTTIQ